MTVALTELEIAAEDGQPFLRFLAGGESRSSSSSALGASGWEARGDADPSLDGGLDGRLERGLLGGPCPESREGGVCGSLSMMLVMLGLREE